MGLFVEPVMGFRSGFVSPETLDVDRDAGVFAAADAAIGGMAASGSRLVLPDAKGAVCAAVEPSFSSPLICVPGASAEMPDLFAGIFLLLF